MENILILIFKILNRYSILYRTKICFYLCVSSLLRINLNLICANKIGLSIDRRNSMDYLHLLLGGLGIILGLMIGFLNPMSRNMVTLGNLINLHRIVEVKMQCFSRTI
jgi:hypothetical protein